MEIPKNIKVIETRTAKIYLFEGIIVARFLEDAKSTIDNAKEDLAAIFNFIPEEKKMPILVDMRKVKSISGEARNYLTKTSNNGPVAAVALLIKSPLSKLIGAFFIGLNRGATPLNLFTDENEAINWLNKSIKE